MQARGRSGGAGKGKTRGGGNVRGKTGGDAAATASGAGPNTNAWLLHPALPLDVRLLGLGAGAVIVGAWATGGEMPFQSLRAGPTAPGRSAGGANEGGVGTLEEATAGSSDLDLDGVTQSTAGGEERVGEAFLEDSATALQLEGSEAAQPSLAAELEERGASWEEGAGEDPSPRPDEQGEAPLADDLQAPWDDPLQPGVEPAEAPVEVPAEEPAGSPAEEPVEEPAGDATVITEDDMKAISDLLAEAVGAGGPLAATAVDTADAGAVLEGNEAGKASGGPGPELTPQDVNSEEGKMPEPEEAAPTEPGLSSTVGSSELPSPTSEPASADTEAVAARRGTSSSSGALPRRTVEAVLELVSPADLVSRALKDGEDIGEQWELYGSMHRQAAADAEFVTEALKLVQGAYEVS